MFETIAKLFYPFSLIVGVISGANYPTYLQLGAENMTFNYQGSSLNRPYDLLSVKNIGSQKVRIDVSSDVGWIFITREGYDNVHNIELDIQNTVSFALDIRTDLVNDGQHTGKIKVDAVYLQDKSILETKNVDIILNKNFIPTLTPGSTVELSPSVPPLTTAPLPSELSVPALTPTPLNTRIITSPITKTPSLTPAISVKATPLKLSTPKPEITPKPTALPSERGKGRSIWNFFRSLWGGIF